MNAFTEQLDVFFNGKPAKECDKKLVAENDKLKIALSESVRLQSHYAALLNTYDGGERMIFKNAREWLERLRKMRTI